MPEARQNNSKLADMLARASNFRALVGMAVDVVGLIHGVASFVGISTPSLSAQGEQRRSAFFNIRRDIGRRRARTTYWFQGVALPHRRLPRNI